MSVPDPTTASGSSQPAAVTAREHTDLEIWVVEPGDHLWSIAESVMHERATDTVDERLIAGYWNRLVQHNRDRLPDPANDDLLFPGQVIELP